MLFIINLFGYILSSSTFYPRETRPCFAIPHRNWSPSNLLCKSQLRVCKLGNLVKIMACRLFGDFRRHDAHERDVIVAFLTIIQSSQFTQFQPRLFHIPQCTIQNRNVHISVLNGVLWVMERVHCGKFLDWSDWPNTAQLDRGTWSVSVVVMFCTKPYEGGRLDWTAYRI